jgi:hypothetical protein
MFSLILAGQRSSMGATRAAAAYLKQAGQAATALLRTKRSHAGFSSLYLFNDELVVCAWRKPVYSANTCRKAGNVMD